VALIKLKVAQKAAAMAYRGHIGYEQAPDKIKAWDDEYALFIKRLIDKQQQLVNQRPRSTLRVINVGRYVED
jgi:hypothetical protein